MIENFYVFSKLNPYTSIGECGNSEKAVHIQSIRDRVTIKLNTFPIPPRIVITLNLWHPSWCSCASCSTTSLFRGYFLWWLHRKFLPYNYLFHYFRFCFWWGYLRIHQVWFPVLLSITKILLFLFSQLFTFRV